MSVRAIHTKVIHSLATDSFINALRQFIARRRQPQCIRSDNGENFERGEKELREVVCGWNQEKIHKSQYWQVTLSGSWRCLGEMHSNTEFRRLWRRAAIGWQKIAYATICEVESIVNGHPVTKVSDVTKIQRLWHLITSFCCDQDPRYPQVCSYCSRCLLVVLDTRR